MPVSLCNSFQKRERKILSQSDIILSGRPFLQYQCLKKSSANFSAESVVVVGMIHMSDPRWSVNVMKLLYPSSRGSGPTKSMATESHLLLGTGRGCSRPIGFDIVDLFCWQSAHDGMYTVSRSFLILGKKYNTQSVLYVFWVPKWPRWLWASRKSVSQMPWVLGISNRSSMNQNPFLCVMFTIPVTTLVSFLENRSVSYPFFMSSKRASSRLKREHIFCVQVALIIDATVRRGGSGNLERASVAQFFSPRR